MMFKKIKRIVNELRANQKKMLYAQEQLYASNKLLHLLPRPYFIPETGWSMTPRAIVHCLNLIHIRKAKTIIEFGSGATTLYIAQTLKNLGDDFIFYSVESDLTWKNAMEAQLDALGLSDSVTILYCPLKDVSKEWAYKEQHLWYDTAILKSEIGDTLFDFVLVDGPFGGSTPYARYSAYPFLTDNSHNGTIWFLDDTSRPMEREIIQTWKTESNLNLSLYKRYGILASESKFDASPYAFE
ncbi:class I SAM-dependent methyltransferase [Leeuwenhoekiella aestuarii]|uniref:class I SAM-dependent methyltransferase n=1 Tax=Leeuwenhoekiella aestuarii TaxID=2249426 RepID=UPI000FFE92CB|nr:class I SAM-dependent methyltransferase [Leeuwenhoekiella aestuarii]